MRVCGEIKPNTVRFLVFSVTVKDTMSIENNTQLKLVEMYYYYLIVVNAVLYLDTKRQEQDTSLAVSATHEFLIKIFLGNLLLYDFCVILVCHRTSDQNLQDTRKRNKVVVKVISQVQEKKRDSLLQINH